MPAGRVLLGLEANMLDASVIWTRIDNLYPGLVAGYDVHTGRQSERETTDTGNGTVYLNDSRGLFDPANTGSTFFGHLHGKPIMLQLWNPLTDTWESQFRGTVDDYGYDLEPSQVVSNVQIACVDMFDYLGNAEVAPGIDGDVPRPGSERVVFYQDATVHDRLEQVLGNAAIDPDMTVVFTGNVRVQETKYEPGEVFLTILRDACDAEFPGIANCYIDRHGRFVFHGRYARFTPEDVAAGATPGAWDFRRWKVGDGHYITLDPERAQVRALAYNQARADIINAAYAAPRGIKDADVPGQVYVDSASITAYGKHSWSATDLITRNGTTTGNNANDECFLFAKYYVDNLKTPRTRIRTLNFRSVLPEDARADAVWPFLVGVDISDVTNISVGYPNGFGIVDEDYYVEGFDLEVRPLGHGDDLDDVNLSLNVSPAGWWPDDYFP